MIVLDSNVVSYIFNGDARASWYAQRIRGLRALISFQTLEELWFGALEKNWGDRRKNELARHLEQYEVVWPDTAMVELCARLRRERQRAGRELTTADAWIAATAISLGCPLAAHDRDFSGIPNLELVQNPEP